MKTKELLMLMILGFALVFTSCENDISGSVIDTSDDSDDIEEPADQDEPELDPLLVGSWKLDPTQGSLAVGPSANDLSWWAITNQDIEARSCIYDDLYIFGEDGTFENDLGDATWLESWQEGVEDGEDGCGAPVPPHDGVNAGTWTADGETVSLSGEGLFLGLAKVHNTGEDGNPSNDTIEYEYTLVDNDQILEVRISGWLGDNPDATWFFRFTNQLDAGSDDGNTDDGNTDDGNDSSGDADVTGTWTLDPTEGSIAVGPSATDLSWWSISAADVETRGCLYDDLYIFNEDGSFENDLGDATWLEPWQGVDPEACGQPVAPHDGTTIGDWTVDAETVTVSGSGIYLGLAKVHNGGEDGNPVDDTINYNFSFSDDGTIMEVTIDGWNSDLPEATWFFRFLRQ